VRGFVSDVVGPLNHAVGDAWMRGPLEIFEEHLYSEAVQAVLRQALASIPQAEDGRRVLLTTLPGEPHGLGLLMTEAVLALEGCCCVSLGIQTPLLDIARAARAMGCDIVGLGFTGCLPLKQVIDSLTELRAELPPAVQLWAGGQAAGLQRRAPEGVVVIDTLQQIPRLLRPA
jgi:methanogenic corrinoid protein MtbC1